MHVALSPAARRVDDERRRVEAGRDASDVLLDDERGVERRSQVFDALHEVVHVDVVGMHVDVPEPLDQKAHDLHRVVDAANEHALVSHRDAAFEEQVHRVLRDRRDFFRVIEMRVQGDLFVHLSPLVDDGGERVGPRDVGENLLRHHRGPLGREAQPRMFGMARSASPISMIWVARKL